MSAESVGRDLLKEVKEESLDVVSGTVYVDIATFYLHLLILYPVLKLP